MPGLLMETNRQTASVRQRELETGRLVLRAAACGEPFVLRRAAEAVAALDAGPARKALTRVTSGLEEGDVTESTCGLLSYGVVLERHGEYDAAEDVYGAVHAARPGDPGAALHVARAARKAGHRERALELYRLVGNGATDSHMRLLVGIGVALVSERPRLALDEVIRAARRGGDAEAVAVAREERARYQLAEGRFSAALRDLAAAAARYRSHSDRTRVLHSMSDLLAARGDLSAAREALLAALDHVDPRHRVHTVQRLRTIARAMGDDLGLRRTRGQGTRGLVTLTPPRARAATPSRTARVRRLRSALPAFRG